MTKGLLLLRQVSSTYLRDGQVSKSAFNPSSDDDAISVDNSDLIEINEPNNNYGDAKTGSADFEKL